jgi:hypothetical protein
VDGIAPCLFTGRTCFRLLLAFLLHVILLIPPAPVSAQSLSCAVQVFYGDEGVDEGPCTDMGAGLCKTREYALEQGKAICPDEVQIMSGGLLRDVYRSPDVFKRQPLDWLVTASYWLVPFLAGGLAGWLLGRGSRAARL